MDTLPTDVKLYDIALNLDLHDLRHYCQTNRNMRNICQDNNFWRQKTLRDFGNISNINGAPWRSVYIWEYERPDMEKCIKDQVGHGGNIRYNTPSIYGGYITFPTPPDRKANDAIILNNKLATLMELTHFPIGVGYKLPRFLDVITNNLRKINGPVYTAELFKQWWYNYIDDHGLSEHDEIYPDRLIRKAFGSELGESYRQKFINRLKSINYSITFEFFDSILNKTIEDLFPNHSKVNIDANMARVLCSEHRRLFNKW